MAAFLIDEDLPRLLADALRGAGHQAVDVRDVGLRGQPDSEIHRHAVESGHTLMTGDVELGGWASYPVPPAGTLLVRLPDDLSADLRIKLILAAVSGLDADDLAGSVGVIEPRGLRLRKVR